MTGRVRGQIDGQLDGLIKGDVGGTRGQEHGQPGDASRVLGAQSQHNSSLTFTVLAGIVVGGTSILGGEGAAWRPAVGVLSIAQLAGNGDDVD
jgi:hypothetical protein